MEIGSLFEAKNTYISNRLINVRRREPPLVKVERKRVMRRKIVDIYKALRHFGVTAKEIRDIAEGYRHWIAHPFESRSNFNMVYCMAGKLYSVPYPIKSSVSSFVGIEIEGIVYLNQYICGVTQNELETSAKTIKSRLAKKCGALRQFKLRMPTCYEAKALAEKTEGNTKLDGAVYNKYGDVWIMPNPDHQERTLATVCEHRARSHQPSENTRATLYLVTDLDDEQIFFGEVDEYGTPTPDTQELYKELSGMIIIKRF